MKKVLCFALVFSFFYCFAAKIKKPEPNLKKALNKALIDLRIAPEHPKFYFHAADLYKKLGQPQKAISVYQRLLGNKLIKNKDARFKGTFSLASMYLFTKQFKRAAIYYNKALSLEPLSVPARINLGTAYLNSRFYVKAINEYLQVLNNNPNYAIIYFNMGLAYEKLKKFKHAKNSYRTFLSIVKKDGAKSFRRYNKYIKIAKKKLSKIKRKSRVIKKGKVITVPNNM